ncbi:MAG: D-2-hydroxyacid dehydrogenase [Clostridium sp.]|uniref:D-2-hydroxyacid dehydrogenase n=1 Tax=Clostridium culturomicium TaxID=1499683 RepID=UPI002909C45E|nr:D-2-hydroxyacid dehydrogenase [Clostridium sp.]MDU7084152.1 D-2-hydroxyacid dehydrogenase [Clostridium sp.]
MYDEINVVVLMPMDADQKCELMKVMPCGNFIFASAQEISNATLADAHVIIGNIEPFRLHAAKNLQWLQLNSAGADIYVKEGVLKPGTILTNATGAYGLAISEHMIGMLLSILKKLYLYRDNQSSSQWKDEGEVKSIYGSTALIIGLGDIGGEFAKRFKALGGYTIGVRRTDANKPDYLDELYLMDKIDELLPKADVVALSLPNTKETYKMFDAKRIAKMKDGAALLNVGRGTCIDTEALCDALESGKLMGAGLDVTDPEPLPSNHRLWTIKNAIITPHVSGDYHLKETHNRIVRIAIDNLKAYVNGEEMRNLVDFSTGYKSKSSK